MENTRGNISDFHLTLWLAARENLWLAAPEIVRFQHGATSSGKQYNTSFIPRLHDLCFVLKIRNVSR